MWSPEGVAFLPGGLAGSLLTKPEGNLLRVGRAVFDQTEFVFVSCLLDSALLVWKKECSSHCQVGGGHHGSLCLPTSPLLSLSRNAHQI